MQHSLRYQWPSYRASIQEVRMQVGNNVRKLKGDRQPELGHQWQLPQFISNNIPSPWAQVCWNCMHDNSGCLTNECAGLCCVLQDRTAKAQTFCHWGNPRSANQFEAFSQLWLLWGREIFLSPCFLPYVLRCKPALFCSDWSVFTYVVCEPATI